jgi:hypothetical protein
MTDDTTFPPENNFPAGYQPAKVWEWKQGNGGRFANINRPDRRPDHDKELPVGKHPLQLYSLATPNGVKVTVMFEELLAAGHKDAEYDAWLINIGEGDQFGSGFVDVNPNSKIPALMDHSTTGRHGCSNPARSCCISPRSSALSCRRIITQAHRGAELAVLADGLRPVPGRRLRAFLCLCADEDRIRDRPLRHGGEAPARRARQEPGP